MTDLVRSDAKQGSVQDSVLMDRRAAARRDERTAEPPLWLVLLARWGSAEAVNGVRPRAELAESPEGEAFAPG